MTSTLLTTKDGQGRPVTVHVHALQGAVVSILRTNRGGTTTQIGLALTADECRQLAAVFITAAGDKVVR